MKLTKKLEKLVLGDEDILIVTLGSLEYNIIPTQKDMNDYRKLMNNYFGKSKGRVIVVPPVVKFQVLRGLRKGASK